MKQSEINIITTVLDMYKDVVNKSKTKRVKKEMAKLSFYTNEDLDIMESFVPSEYSLLTKKTTQDLSLRSKLMILQIMDELHDNNALWEFDHTKNTRDSMSIKELRSKEILYKTPLTDVHFVNPFYIRRGTEGAVTFNMVKLLLEHKGRVSKDMIRSLRARNKGEVIDRALFEASPD
jgi:hypothetical protein